MQGLSDLRTRDKLIGLRVERCHVLHYLQMASEKICKAHLASHTESNLRNTHACVQRVLPMIARQLLGSNAQSWQMDALRHFARQIELLAPAVHEDGKRRDNTEYPWVDGSGKLQTPCEYPFPDLDDGDRIVVLVIRLLREAGESYL